MKAIFSFAIFLSFALAFPANAQTDDLSLEDRRQIVESLLRETLKDSERDVIRVSTANLPEELIKSFPTFKNKRIEIVEASLSSETCAYEFGEFEIIGGFVSVSFGDCNSGLAYDFKKFGDKWKSVGLNIPK